MERGYPAVGPYGSAGPTGMPMQAPGVGMPWGAPPQQMPWTAPGQQMDWGAADQQMDWAGKGQQMPWAGKGQQMGWGRPDPAQMLGEILNALYSAYNDLTLQCAAASIGHYIPEMKQLPGFEAVHEANYEAAYHLTTAIGAARMIMAGAREPGYFALLVTCERKSREYQQKAREAWQEMAQAEVPQQAAPYVRLTGDRIKATSGHLQRAIAMTNATLGQETVQRLMQLSREARGEEE